MLKLMLSIFLFTALQPYGFAKNPTTGLSDDGQNGDLERSVGNNGKTIEIRDRAKLLGKYDNLLVNETSLVSNVVSVAGRGIAIKIDSDGSRNKFRILVPIIKVGKSLYVDCIYKIAYDSVDQTRAVGATCKKTNLRAFNVSAAINQDNMIVYTNTQKWIKDMLPATCINAIGLEYAEVRIARCSTSGTSDDKNQKIMIFNKVGQLLVSISGFEFIPDLKRSRFALTATGKNQEILFDGNVKCLAEKFDLGGALSDAAKIAKKFEINYTLRKGNECIGGEYS